MALRSFSELSTGTQYPPERERARVAAMDRWLLRYSRRNEDDKRRLKPNLYRLIATLWTDMVMGTQPQLVYGEPGAERIESREQEALDLLLEPVTVASRGVVTDMIRYGAGVFENDIPFHPQNVDTRYYFRVAEPERQRYLGAITAMPYRVSATPAQQLADSIALTYYGAGQDAAVRRFHAYNGVTVGEMRDEMELPAANPVLVVQGNISAASDVYGVSDYEDIDEYIVELQRRETAVSEALDLHVKPHLAVPEGVLAVDEAGRTTINKDGMMIEVPEGAAPPSFVQWEADFDAHESAMERAMERIRHFSQIHAVILSRADSSYNFPTGSALRRSAVLTINRINVLRQRLTHAIRQVAAENMDVARASGMEAPALDPMLIQVVFPPALGIEDDEEGGDESPEQVQVV